MPNYTLRHKKSGKTKTDFMSISEMEAWKKKNKGWEVMCGMPMVHSGTGLKKPDAGFRDILKNIKKKHNQGITRSTINTF